MQIIPSISKIAIIVMTILSFSNLFGLHIAGISVLIGILFFFVSKAIEKKPFTDSGLDINSLGSGLKNHTIWLWIALPLIMDAVSITFAKLFIPGYIEHVLARTDIFLSLDKAILMVCQLAVLALGEEIAWRAFFQKQLSRVIPMMPAILITSVLFALGHLTTGNSFVVMYDISFVFINSILYGIVFHKSNNAYVSAMSHFIANLFSVIILVVL
jgi:uncharacterized protein